MKKDEVSHGMKEFDLAWNEFFKKKKRPKNDEEDRKQQEEFMYWYNNVRKQTDTGKTPAEMFEEIYGKEPGSKPKEPSRMMNFEWDKFDEEEFNPYIRYCPECDNWGLEVTGNVNVYECNICGSIWKRLKPINDGMGNMVNIPKKLKKLLRRV